MERINKKWCANINDWKNWIPYPYAKGLWKALKDPQYIKDRDELFAVHGNGWWWGIGWWSDEKYESPMEYHARKRKERGA